MKKYWCVSCPCLRIVPAHSKSFRSEWARFQRLSVKAVVEMKWIKTMNRDRISPKKEHDMQIQGARRKSINANNVLGAMWCGCRTQGTSYYSSTSSLVHEEPSGSCIDFWQTPWCWFAYSGALFFYLFIYLFIYLFQCLVFVSSHWCKSCYCCA